MGPGSISHGTLLIADLVTAFSEWLEEHGDSNDQAFLNANAFEISQAHETDPFAEVESEYADWLLQELFDRIGEHAPEGYYFGAHEGDGTDFGFWPIYDD